MGGTATSPSRSRLIDEGSSVIIPDTGAARYWYVDPRATGTYSPGNNLNQQFNPAGESPPRGDQGEAMQQQAIMDALERMFQLQPPRREISF